MAEQLPDRPGSDWTETFLIEGYRTAPSQGTATLTSFNQASRIRRAGVALAMAWLAAVASIFIPVAHFLLVPGFVLLGVVVFVKRIKTPIRATVVEGTCPDCGEAQQFEASGRWHLPRQLTCSSCHRTLTARQMSG